MGKLHNTIWSLRHWTSFGPRIIKFAMDTSSRYLPVTSHDVWTLQNRQKHIGSHLVLREVLRDCLPASAKVHHAPLLQYHHPAACSITGPSDKCCYDPSSACALMLTTLLCRAAQPHGCMTQQNRAKRFGLVQQPLLRKHQRQNPPVK